MKKIAFKKIDLKIALLIIFFFTASLSVIIGAKAVNALSFNFGGLIWYVMECESAEGLGTGCPGTCPLCTGLLGPACAGVTEIRFFPYGGTPGFNFICPVKGFPYKGYYPWPGAYIIGNGFSPIFLYQIGVSI